METLSKHRSTVPCSPAWIAIPTSRPSRTNPALPNQLASPAMPTNRRCSTMVFTGRRWLPAIQRQQIAKTATAIFMKFYLPAIPSPVPPKINIPKMCGECHAQAMPGMAGKAALAYQESVHGKLVAAGNEKAAVCSDCHGTHDIRRAGDPHFADFPSPMFRRLAAKCHTGEQAQFAKSIHGKSLAAGNTHAPVCTDCHGVHTIKATNDKLYSWYRQESGRRSLRPVPQQRENDPGVRHSGRTHGQLQRQLSRHGECSGLHADRKLLILPRNPQHPSVVRSGVPRSTPANLVKTCGQCHPAPTLTSPRARSILIPKRLPRLISAPRSTT